MKLWLKENEQYIPGEYETQCHRCLKNLRIRYHEDGIHTCNPTAGWRKLEQENERLKAEIKKLECLKR